MSAANAAAAAIARAAGFSVGSSDAFGAVPLSLSTAQPDDQAIQVDAEPLVRVPMDLNYMLVPPDVFMRVDADIDTAVPDTRLY